MPQEFHGLEEMDWDNAAYVTIRIKIEDKLVKEAVKKLAMDLYQTYADDFACYVMRKQREI